MLRLFRLLFKNHYWRMLLRRETWHEVWLSLTRAHKDRRAVKHVFLVALMALLPVLCLLYLILLIGSGGWVFVPFVIPVIWWRSRRAKQDDVSLQITSGPQPVTYKKLTKDEVKTLRAYFEGLTIVYAVMVARAGSEGYLKEKVVPEGYEVHTRRVHLDLLKSTGVWEKMDRSDREAMMLPDGHWEWDLIHRVSLGLEFVRLLRWILRIDFVLPLVGQQLKARYAIANELVDNVKTVVEGEDLIDAATVEVARDAAQIFYHRCIAEGISLGYYETENQEARQWADRVAAQLAGQQSEDLVLGARLVSEATEDELRWATSLSRRRMEFLEWALTVIEDGRVPEEGYLCVSCL